VGIDTRATTVKAVGRHTLVTKNVFPYPGNKARHSDWILQHIPDHECYVELFGGAAGVLFNKPRSKIEVYNDLNGDIPHFFEVLRDKGNELQEWLRNVPYSREIYDEWADEYYEGFRPDDDIERAGRFFFLRYSQFGGKIESKQGFATSKRPNRSSAFRSAIESLYTFRDRLSGVVIESQPAEKLIDRHDSKDTLFYADPPYEGTEGRYNSSGFNHRKLAEKAKEIDGNIAISYDSIPPHYGDKFSVVSKSSRFAIGAGGRESTEYLIMNYDPETTPMFSEAEQETLF